MANKNNIIPSIFEKDLSMTEKRIMTLANFSWYYERKMEEYILRKSSRLLKTGEHSAIIQGNLILSEYYKSRYNHIFKEASELFPERASIINACYEAHKEEKYELSIPIILMQIDGICKAKLNGELFQRNKEKKPKTSFFINHLPENHRYLRIYSHPFREITAINASRERKSGEVFEDSPNRLYRHKIIHGEDFNYASHTNAYKTVSLLACVCSIIPIVNKIMIDEKIDI